MRILLSALALLTATSSVAAIKCHQCGGAEKIPGFAKTALSKLNITLRRLQKTSGSDMCSNGTFCIKRAKVYQIGYSGVNLKWTSYTKGCAALREDNNQIPTNTCYDIGQVNTNTSGYTAKRVDCYCNKDFCNSSPIHGIITILLMILVKITI